MMLQLIQRLQKYGVINPEVVAAEMNWNIEETRRAIEDLKTLGLLEEISMRPMKCQGCKHQCSL